MKTKTFYPPQFSVSDPSVNAHILKMFARNNKVKTPGKIKTQFPGAIVYALRLRTIQDELGRVLRARTPFRAKLYYAGKYTYRDVCWQDALEQSTSVHLSAPCLTPKTRRDTFHDRTVRLSALLLNYVDWYTAWETNT